MDQVEMLRKAGLGHFVIGAKWRTRDGTYRCVDLVVPRDCDGHAALRQAGWPGHSGRPIDYLKEDVRKWVAQQISKLA